MNRKWFLIIVILLTIVNLSALGTFMCKRWCCRLKKGDDRFIHHLKRELELTDEQVSKMKDSREKFHPKMESISQAMRDKKKDLVKTLMDENPDSTRIDQILREMDSSQFALHVEVVNHLLTEKGIFTPKQQEKFFSIVLEPFSGEKPDIKGGNKHE